MHELWKDKLKGFFCSYCHSPLIGGSLLNPLVSIKDGVYLGEIEGENSPLILPINLYFRFRFAFYSVTGTGKTRAAMNLAINSRTRAYA